MMLLLLIGTFFSLPLFSSRAQYLSSKYSIDTRKFRERLSLARRERERENDRLHMLDEKTKGKGVLLSEQPVTYSCHLVSFLHHYLINMDVDVDGRAR